VKRRRNWASNKLSLQKLWEKQTVKLVLKQLDGFTGEKKELLQLDTAQMEPSMRKQVEQLIDDAKFFDLPTVIQAANGADFIRYEITMADGGREHTVIFEDDGSLRAAPMRKFVGSLLRLRY
jgi:hypothetical protein